MTNKTSTQSNQNRTKSALKAFRDMVASKNKETTKSTTVNKTNNNNNNDNTTAPTSKLRVFLDIDHTLIYSKFFENKAEADANVANMPKMDGETVQYLRICGKEESDAVLQIHFRPGLREFLDNLSNTCELHLFTAGAQYYAEDIVAKTLDPDGKYFGQRIWHEEHCHKQYGGGLVKHLSTLPPLAGDHNKDSLKRIVLVDDNVANLRANPENTILASEFTNDPQDDGLEKIWKMLQALLDVSDVRPELAKHKEEVDPSWYAAMFV